MPRISMFTIDIIDVGGRKIPGGELVAIALTKYS
jgi:hypothetical protein